MMLIDPRCFLNYWVNAQLIEFFFFQRYIEIFFFLLFIFNNQKCDKLDSCVLIIKGKIAYLCQIILLKLQDRICCF